MACPICGKSAQHAYRPFCSKRCADIDLGRWMTGKYAAPSQREDDADELLEELSRQDDTPPEKPH